MKSIKKKTATQRRKNDKKTFQNGGFYNYRPQCGKKKKPNITLNVLRGIAAVFLRKPKIDWRTPAPDEPALYVCNHTKIYAPAVLVIYFRNVRQWANAAFMNYKDCWRQMFDKVLQKRKFLIPLAVLIMPLIVVTFRQMDHIPVYRDARVLRTFKECSDCLSSGRSTVVYAEKYDGRQVNEYLFELQTGYLYAAQKYYADTGKALKIYPVYCAQKLSKFVIGAPVVFNPEVSVKAQAGKINSYLEKTIGELADSLPSHKAVLYK